MNHNVFRDLVPSYIENLTNKETNREMEKHMEHCENCREYFNEMKEDLLLESVDEQKKEDRNIDYLKKIRSKNRKKVFIVVTSLISFFFILAIGYYLIFVRMWIADVDDIRTTVQKQDTTVTLSFKPKNQKHYLLVKEEKLNQNYTDWIVIYEKRDDFSTPAILKDGINITYTFFDENTLLLDSGKKQKLTDEDKILIQYKDRTEEIIVKDLYDPEKKKFSREM